MKIALAQLNYTVGDFDNNSQKIIQHIQLAQQQKAELIVFSELSLCGYPPLDFLENKDFINKIDVYIQKIATHCQDITAIIGTPQVNTSGKGKHLFNSAVVISNGKVQKTIHKTLLPTYDIFDEYRYFESNTQFETIKIKDKTIALTICEDLWNIPKNTSEKENSTLYKKSPLENITTPYDFIINIAASPFSLEQKQNRINILKSNAQTYQKPIIYVNQSACNTDLIFDGGSMLMNAQGELIKNMAHFEEDFFVFDSELFDNAETIHYSFKEEDRTALQYQAIKAGLKDYFAKMGFKKAVLGLSGGIDSALVAAIACDALGSENVFGILMPSKYSSDHSISDAVDLAENLKMKYEIIPIKDMVTAFDTALLPLFSGTNFGVAEENIQARIRGTLLMAYSNKFGNILLNTSNKSESAVGYSTLYGDMNGSLSILGDVYKTDVFKLAEYINRNGEIIPFNTINKPPSAELRPDQKDSDSLPDYEVLDAILFRLIEEKKSTENIISEGFEEEVVKKTASMLNRNEYKRFQSPPILRISSKAFGLGRRMPLVAKYDF